MNYYERRTQITEKMQTVQQQALVCQRQLNELDAEYNRLLGALDMLNELNAEESPKETPKENPKAV